MLSVEYNRHDSESRGICECFKDSIDRIASYIFFRAFLGADLGIEWGSHEPPSLFGAAASIAWLRGADTKPKLLLPSDQPDNFNFRLMWYNPVPPINQETYRLRIGGLVERPQTLAVTDLRRFPHVNQDSRMKCVQCWSSRTTWGGFRVASLFDLVNLEGAPRQSDSIARTSGMSISTSKIFCLRESCWLWTWPERRLPIVTVHHCGLSTPRATVINRRS